MSPKTFSSIVYWLNDSLYLNITNRCSNDCYFCIRRFSTGVGGFRLTLQKEPTIKEIISNLQRYLYLKNWKNIVFCGFGEPFERFDCILAVTRWIKKYYGKSVVRIDTNGLGFRIHKNRKVLQELKAVGVDKISVSLNAHNEVVYNQICRPKYKHAFSMILKFIKHAARFFDVEITALTIPEVDFQKMEMLAMKLGVKFRKRFYVSGAV
jgi:TatD family-associated radical SAM protein